MHKKGLLPYTVSNNLNKVNKYFSKGRDTLKDEYLKKTIDDIYGSSPSIKATLKFVKGESIYKVDQKLQNENHNNLANKLLKSIAGGDNTYYVNLKLNKNQIQDCKLLGECFIINMPDCEVEFNSKAKKNW